MTNSCINNIQYVALVSALVHKVVRQSEGEVLGGFDVAVGGLQFDILDEGQHAFVTSHEAICCHICIPR